MATEVHMHGRIGESIKRKEDGRFLRGKGNYLDDIELPAMLHMVILRSPHAHARINSVDTAAACSMPGVIAVVTGELMAQHKLAWMPTLSYDTQAVLATDKVRFQGQEVAAVVAETKAQAEDARDAIIVDYDVLPAVISPQQAKEADAVLIRDDKENQKDNHIYHWEAGDQATTQAAFAKADKVVRLHTFYPRCHPAPLETCGCIADVNGATGKATIYMTSQAPHAIRTVFALVTGLPEQNIRVISPGFARDFHMTGDLALDKDGKMLALRVHLDSDNGAFFADAQPTKFKAGLFHIVTGSYDIPTAHVTADGYYTNKAPGGVAYRCSFRVTEASYLIERLVTNAAIELGVDQAEFRRKNFIRKEQFPYHSATGWVYDSGDYHKAMDVALEQLGYDEMRKDVEARRKKGEVTGIGIASFTEVVGAGHGADFDILGLRMFDSAELRVHPTGKAILRMGTKSQGQGHETTFAQIVTEELGIPAADVAVEEGDTDTAPYGLGTYASRSTPVAGAATAVVSRKLRGKARALAAHLLEVSEDDLEWDTGRFYVKGSPDKAKTIQEIAFAAYTNVPEGMEAGLEGVHYYDPPNMTYPFGTYAVVVDVDKGTGQVKVRRVVAVDDCGVRINPMIVEGQIHGGLAEGYGIAFMQLITFDADGNCIGSNFTDYLLPTAVETPRFELGETTTPSPHHPLGAKGVGESPTVGSPAAYVNAVIDALAPYGVRNIDMPVTSDKVWAALRAAGVNE